jgi:hypothetical protein
LTNINIYQTSLFTNQKKKLHKNQIQDLDLAIKKIMDDPTLGQQKIGDLISVWVYKFSMVKQQYLLAYTWDQKSRTFVALGVHENFYKDLKKAIKF